MIEFCNVSFSYPDGTPALNNVTFTISQGQKVACMGATGAGKTTLALLVNGLLAPTQGEICIHGVSTSGSDINLRKKVRLVFHNPDQQVLTSSCLEEILFSLSLLGEEQKNIQWHAEEILKEFGLQDFAHISPFFLSGGQKQKLALAAAVASDPAVLVLDEATRHLDYLETRRLLSVLFLYCNRKNATLFHITHRAEEAMLAERVMVLFKGRLVYDGTPRQVLGKGSLLNDLGVELSPAAKAVAVLNERGFHISGQCLTSEEVAEELCHFLLKT